MTSDITVISIFLALLLMCLFTERLSFTQIKISFLYYCTTVIYALLFLGSMPAWSDHAIYALLAAPFIFISTILGAVTILGYALFNLLVSIDYIIYPNIDTIVTTNFVSSQLFFASILIIGSIFKGKTHDYRVANSFMDWLGSHTDILRSLSKVEKNQ